MCASVLNDLCAITDAEITAAKAAVSDVRSLKSTATAPTEARPR